MKWVSPEKFINGSIIMTQSSLLGVLREEASTKAIEYEVKRFKDKSITVLHENSAF